MKKATALICLLVVILSSQAAFAQGQTLRFQRASGQWEYFPEKLSESAGK